jgi:4-hydroxybenzoate polyprenyltransferase
MLLVLAFSLALISLPWTFAAVLGTYYVLTLLYSLLLKRLMALDVIALAMLYTLRVFAGGAALQLTLTFWLLAFAMFLFLSLALAKRFAELRDALERGRTGKTRGRDYDPHDLEMIASLGAAAGYQSVMVLALYLREQSTITLYANPDVMWLACPILLFWITRVWMLTHRGQMHEDPVVFAARDWISQIAGVLFGLTFLAAS